MSVTISVGENKKTNHLFRCPKFLKDRNSLFYYYLALVVIGIFFFGVSLFSNYFTTPFTGDYTAQQYAFYTNGYDDWWHFFTTGEFVLYDTNTYLGASNIGSNSFYYLFDPFFMPILMFPRNWIPQGIAIMTIFKMALAGLLFNVYISYFGLKKFTSRLAGFMYSFCGWTTWYLWFNHFTGVAVIFPVILLGIEKILKEKKPWLLSASLFCLGLTNFFFFFTFTICAFIYAMFRYFQLLKAFSNVKDALITLGIGFMGFLVGCLLASVIVIPAMMIALNAPRATSSTYLPILLESVKTGDWGTFFFKIFSWESENATYKVYYPILDFIFPVMSDRGTPLTKLGHESYDNIAGSLFCFSPIILFLIPALISSTKQKHYSPLIATGAFLLMLFTPFCYYAFHGFTYAYSRWTLFVTTSLITYVAFYLDRIKDEPRWHVLLGGAFALLMAWLAIILAIHMANKYEDFNLRYVYPALGTYGFIMIEGSVFSVYVIVITLLIYNFHNTNKLEALLTFTVTIEALIMGATTLAGHGYEDYMKVNNGYENNKEFQTLIDQVKRDDPTYYRCYSSQENASARNDSMRHNYNGLGTFHSIYNYNIASFLNWSQINDYEAPSSYSGSYIEKRVDLDNFLGVKYYFINKETAFYGDEKAKEYKSIYYRPNVPLGFVDISNKYPNDKYYVFENENFTDFAFSYDKVATYEDTDELGNVSEPAYLFNNTYENEELYLKAAIIGNRNLKYVSGLINEDNIKNYQVYDKDLDVSDVYPSTYDISYYDVNHDVKGADDASKESFVSKLLDLSDYSCIKEKPDKWKLNGRYVTIITPLAGFPYDESGLTLYLKSSYMPDREINVYITTIDEDGVERFITYDNHNDNKFSLNYSIRKNYRGFYIQPTVDSNGNRYTPKINKIIIVSKKTEMDKYALAYKTGNNILDTMNKVKEYPVTDINYKTNHFDFKTNYESNRVIVTQLPYEDGWKLKAFLADGSTKDIDIFTAQGGFVSFVSEVGAVSYSLDYYTPYLRMSSYISAIGVFIFAASELSYLYLSLYWINKKIKKDWEFSRNQSKNLLF